MGKLNFSVVAWSTANGQQLEAIAVKKLAVGSDDPVVGSNVQMQYNGQIWKGQIMSLHENMKSAKSALENELEDSPGVRTEMITLTMKEIRERGQKTLDLRNMT
ncbi:hypothetical protein OS493_037648 [Desmophyllum pertusum]|uniref:Uncharacterized protein n=1 Tax=Desmophyllum pertusum TaxID=174260 RepID=A0A9W9YA73_9CNID|nr:hypothetical protein OS493_037648 [Desmophyllum pertusum]